MTKSPQCWKKLLLKSLQTIKENDDQERACLLLIFFK